MTDLRKAAEQALEALEANLGNWAAKTKATIALREALAQPEHEPHRQWRGLTEEDIAEIAEKLGLADVAWVDLMQAIERRLKRRNT